MSKKKSKMRLIFGEGRSPGGGRLPKSATKSRSLPPLPPISSASPRTSTYDEFLECGSAASREDKLSLLTDELLQSSDDDDDDVNDGLPAARKSSPARPAGRVHVALSPPTAATSSIKATTPTLRLGAQQPQPTGLMLPELELVYPNPLQESDLSAVAYDGMGYPVHGHMAYNLRDQRRLETPQFRVYPGTSPLPGVYELSCLFAPRDTERYFSADAVVGKLVVLRGACPVTYNVPPEDLVKGTALTAAYFCATAVEPRPPGHPGELANAPLEHVSGLFHFSHKVGMVLGQGRHSLRVKFEPRDRHLWDYTYACAEVLIVAPYPNVSWPKPTVIPYTEPLSKAQLRAQCTETPPVGVCPRHLVWRCSNTQCCPALDAEVEEQEPTALSSRNEPWEGYGTWTYSPPEGTVLPVGQHALRAFFVPFDLEFLSPLEVWSSVTVIKATPKLVWAPPSVMYDGDKIDERRFLAASTDPAVRGTFTYDTPSGTVLPLGKHTLGVAFAPENSCSYLPVEGKRLISIFPKKTVSIYWNSPKPLVHPEPLNRGHLCAALSTPGARGPIVYDPPLGTVLPAGRHFLTARFVSESAAFLDSVMNVPVTVLQGTPRLVWPTPYPMIEGEVLQETHLCAQARNVEGGYFVYDPPKFAQLLQGRHKLTCTFVPAPEDADNWLSATMETTIEVRRRQKRRTQLVWETPPPIVHPAKLTRDVCNAKCKECDGDFAYFPPIGSVLDAGTHNIQVRFRPTLGDKYAPSETLVQLVVLKGRAEISWQPKCKMVIPYGEPVSEDMLCAHSDASGIITYNPPQGTILDAGMYSLTATIVPLNPGNFDPSSVEVPLQITRHTPMLLWELPDASASDSPEAPGAIVYPAMLRASLFEPTLIFPLCGDLPPDHPEYAEGPGYDKPVFPAVAAEGMLKGRFTFSHKEGQILPAGKHRLYCRYVPDDAINFFSAEACLCITVHKGAPIIYNWKSEPTLLYGTALDSERHLNAVFDMEESLLEVTYDPPAGHIFASTGTKDLTLTVQPRDRDNFVSVKLNATIIVDRLAVPVIWHAPTPIVFGCPLNKAVLCAELDHSRLTVDEQAELSGGKFVYTPGFGAVLPAGEQNLLAAVYNPPPSATNFMESQTCRILLRVQRATPKLVCKPVKALTYGTPLAQLHVNPTVVSHPCAVTPIPGSFSYPTVQLGTVLPPGKHRIGVDFLSANPMNATSCSTFLYLDVYRAIPRLQWPAFQDSLRAVKSGYKLTAKDMDAVAQGVDGGKVEGAFFFTPPLGATLGVKGVRELRCDFVVSAAAAKFYSPPPPLFVKLNVQ